MEAYVFDPMTFHRFSDQVGVRCHTCSIGGQIIRFRLNRVKCRCSKLSLINYQMFLSNPSTFNRNSSIKRGTLKSTDGPRKLIFSGHENNLIGKRVLRARVLGLRTQGNRASETATFLMKKRKNGDTLQWLTASVFRLK